jgi:hypothetical protein
VTPPGVLLSGHQGAFKEIVTDPQPQPLVAGEEIGALRILIQYLRGEEEILMEKIHYNRPTLPYLH